MNKGFVILAQNTFDTNYVKCAEVLAKSIRNVMPDANISLITDDVEDSPYFNKVIALPYGDQDPYGKWKLVNDWQIYEASPYDYTIKLEADLYLPTSIDYWWDILKDRDVVVSNTIRNYKQEISDVRVYRRFLDDNKLPDVYNSITYFKKSELAEKFFTIVKDVFVHWKEYKKILKCKIDEEVSTDWAYSIACHILGVQNTTLPTFKSMCMIHMKQFINDIPTPNWTDKYIYEISKHSLRINTVPQMYPFHYHIKSFCDKLDKAYD